MLALGGKVAVSQVVPVRTLVAVNVGGVQDRKGQTRKTAFVDFIRGQPGGGVYGVRIGWFDVRK